MKSITAAICFTALFYLVASENTIVNVDLYYESLCPDSINFVRDQLVPTYPHLKKFLHINFVPYGKSTHFKTDSTWHFTCQHGQPECRGNKAQACAISEIQNLDLGLQDKQQLLVDLVGCAMTSQNPETSVTLCALQIGLKEDSKNHIVVCKGNSQGDELLAGHGNTTNLFQKPIAFVPTIVINGVYSKENQHMAVRNFKKLICSHIPANEMPAFCKAVN